jgi:dipeptidase E
MSSAELDIGAEHFLGLFRSSRRVAVICNAMDATSSRSQQSAIEEELRTLSSAGFDVQNVDLRKYFGKPDLLSLSLGEFDGLWVRGGNTFVLRAAFALSGADKYVRQRILDDSLVYGGSSAGSCLLSPRIEVLEIVDDPSDVGRTYGVDVYWDGLGIVDFVFVPHLHSSKLLERQAMDEIVEELKVSGEKYRALENGEALVIQGGNIQLLREGRIVENTL